MPRRLKPPWTAVRTYPPNSEEEVRQRPFAHPPGGSVATPKPPRCREG